MNQTIKIAFAVTKVNRNLTYTVVIFTLKLLAPNPLQCYNLITQYLKLVTTSEKIETNTQFSKINRALLEDNRDMPPSR